MVNTGRQSFRAFTLIELLAIVAIIMLLLSLLAPALGRARKRAELVPCMNNLRQLYNLCIGYAGDQKSQELPQGLSENPEQLNCNGNATYIANFTALNKYMNEYGFTPQVWYCPAFPDRDIVMSAWGDKNWYNSGNPWSTGTPGEFPIGYFYLGNSSSNSQNYTGKFQEWPPRTLNDLMNTNTALAGDYCLAPSPGVAAASQVPSWRSFPHYGVEEPAVSQSIMANGSVKKRKLVEMQWHYSYWAPWELYW
jgi:type II secretory pathway pseudopilin PulG